MVGKHLGFMVRVQIFRFVALCTVTEFKSWESNHFELYKFWGRNPLKRTYILHDLIG